MIGDELTCRREVGDAVDRYAVAVYSDDNLVGHFPKKISIACSLFLRHRGADIMLGNWKKAFN